MEPIDSTIQILSSYGDIVPPENITSEQKEACFLALNQVVDCAQQMETFRLDMLSAAPEQTLRRLTIVSQLLNNCFAKKLLADCIELLKHIQTYGISKSILRIELFITDLFSFSIVIQTVEFQATSEMSSASAERSDESRRQSLVMQLHKSLTEFDDENGLRIIAQIEKLNPKDQIVVNLRPLISTFKFDKALSVLTELCGESSYGNRKPVVLAVDDIPQNLVALKTILGQQYKFVGVTSGQAALQYIETNIPDVYILDIEMPEMNGFELVEQIRRKRKFAPIVFLTASATREHVMRAFELGITDFLVKPCNKIAVKKKLDLFLLLK
ncbi:MAG: response regulator [Thermoguttaceae bacterium]